MTARIMVNEVLCDGVDQGSTHCLCFLGWGLHEAIKKVLHQIKLRGEGTYCILQLALDTIPGTSIDINLNLPVAGHAQSD